MMWRRHMKLAAMVVVALIGSVASADVLLLDYQMSQAGPQVEHASVEGGDLTAGNGLAQFELNNTGTPHSSKPVLTIRPDGNNTFTGNAELDTLSIGSEDQQYFSFTMTVGANVTDLDLTEISMNVARGGASNSRKTGFYYKLNGSFLAESNMLKNYEPAVTSPNWNVLSDDLSTISAYQNLVAGDVVEILVPYAVSGAGNAHTFASLHFDDIQVRGEATIIPEPTSLSLVLLGTLAIARRR